MNLAEAINQLENEKDEQIKEHKKTIKGLESAINELRKRNTVCLQCKGAKGSTYRIVAEADPEWHNCSRCQGTGIEPKF